jgi:hypothetical protein
MVAREEARLLVTKDDVVPVVPDVPAAEQQHSVEVLRW